MPLTVKDILGMEKYATNGPKELSHATPRMMSGPATGSTNSGTVNVVLLSSRGILGKNPLHSRFAPFPAMTGNGLTGLGSVLRREAIRG